MQKVILRSEIAEYGAYIDQPIIDYIRDGQIETYESFSRFDLIAFDWYDLQDANKDPSQIIIYLDDKNNLFYICEDEQASQAVKRFFNETEANEQSLYLFFKNMFKGTSRQMEQLENKVCDLDDDVTDGTEDGLRERLTDTRYEVLRVKKYYEQLEFLFEEICDETSERISTENMRYFEILRSRSIRLSSQAQNLRDYIVQVRESYQAQISIEQNNLMKVFTLVTSIFLPLTLIVGWYGMNLKMPEFTWEHGYLFVIVLCLVVCAVWYVIFKKKKW